MEFQRTYSSLSRRPATARIMAFFINVVGDHRTNRQSRAATAHDINAA
jgi:hypothetical protein